MSAREEILARIRAARGPAVPLPEPIRPAGAPASLDLFEQRLVDYRATVIRSTQAGLPAALARLLGDDVPVLPPGLPAGWGLTGVADHPGLGAAELDAVPCVVTGCAVAIALTGTIVLDHGPGQGRRALTLVPDRHICVVRADQVVADVPDAFDLLDAARPVTLISGPSATSDIELERVEGVHGPRTLQVVLLTGSRGPRRGTGPKPARPSRPR